MKTQISRQNFRHEKRYSGVYQQQGRMITDSDWNELVDLLKERLDDALRDVVASGAPRERGAGIEVAEDGGLQIRPGYIYVDGIGAQITADHRKFRGAGTFGFEYQADFPGLKGQPGKKSIIYADVWERPVTFLEDPGLLDAGLHGADTTSRTRTMAQVKWCPDTHDPEGLGQGKTAIPKKGNAPLSLELRRTAEDEDPCDPCAGEVGVRTRTGDYLFRVEVHASIHFEPPFYGHVLQLKWSSENGAEQVLNTRASTPPPGFSQGPWCYEWFDSQAEKHLGVEYMKGFLPRRGELQKTYKSEPGYDRVRRWDGFCILTRDPRGGKWQLGGYDRGVTLEQGPAPVGASAPHGRVVIKEFGGKTGIEIYLERLTLSLPLEGMTFVAGDYWLAPVREREHDAGDEILKNRRPEGIAHHYLVMGRVDKNGKLAKPTGSEHRRHRFPPLTDLRAADVRFQAGSCANELFDASHDTVSKALRRLCTLAAKDVGFDAGACDNGLFGPNEDTVDKALQRLCSLAAQDVPYTVKKPCANKLLRAADSDVKKALDRLCDLEAKHVVYKPAADCEDLKKAKTVQDALDTLCVRKPSGGCRVALAPGELTQERVRELLEEGGGDLCVCLLPGEHILPEEGLEIAVPGGKVSIVGCGLGSVVIMGNGKLMFRNLRWVRLADLQVNWREAGAPVVFQDCRVVSLDAATVIGWIPSYDKEAMVAIRGLKTLAVRINRCYLSAALGNGWGPALSLPGGEETRLVDSVIRGWVTLYSGYSADQREYREHYGAILEKLIFVEPSGCLLLSRNRIERLAVTDQKMHELVKTEGNVTGAYRFASLTDNIFEDVGNRILAADCRLTSNLFDPASEEVNLQLGAVIASTGIYVGNHGPADDRYLLWNVTRFKQKNRSDLNTLAIKDPLRMMR